MTAHTLRQARTRIAEVKREIDSLERAIDQTPFMHTVERAGYEKRIERLRSEELELAKTIAAAQDASDNERKARDAARLEAKFKNDLEDTNFWFRRFFSSLGLANAAGLVALLSVFAQAADKAALAPHLRSPLFMFTLGLCAAGLIPLLLWAKALWGAKARELPEEERRGVQIREMLAQSLATCLSFASAYTFLQALMQVAGYVEGFTSSRP